MINTTRQRKMFCPIVIVQIGYHDTSCQGTRCVDELIIAQVNADMRNSVAHDMEEHQIAREQFGHPDAISQLTDRIRAMGQHHPICMIENVAHETAAIETSFRAGTAPAVGNPGIAERELRQIPDDIGQRFQKNLARTDWI